MNINDVTPINEAVSVKKSPDADSKKEAVTVTTETIHNNISPFERTLNGFFIIEQTPKIKKAFISTSSMT